MVTNWRTGKVNFNYIETDLEFKDLAKDLDQCSERRGGCESCALENDCFKFFNYIACGRALDKTLKHEDRLEFENTFKNLKKQVTLF